MKEIVQDYKNLLNNLRLINPKTWETSDEVFKAWQDGTAVQGVNTANLAVYRLKNDEAVFELLGREGNPFVDKTLREEACNGILQNKFFFPQGAMKDMINAANKQVIVHYSELRELINNPFGKNDSHVVFDGKNNAKEKRLFNAVYGTDNTRIGSKIFLLRKDIIEAQLKDREDDLIVRTCFLNDHQDFDAVSMSINYLSYAIRGVRLGSVAEGDEPNDSATKSDFRVVIIILEEIVDEFKKLTAAMTSLGAYNDNSDAKALKKKIEDVRKLILSSLLTKQERLKAARFFTERIVKAMVEFYKTEGFTEDDVRKQIPALREFTS